MNYKIFSNYLFSQKQSASPLTVKNYISDLKKFFDWHEKTYHKEFNPNNINQQILAEYKKNLLSKFTLSSIERHFSAIRKYFTFLKETKLIEANPFDEIILSKQLSEDKWHLKPFKNSLSIDNSSDLTIKNYIIDIKQFLLWASEYFLEDKNNIFSFFSNNAIENYREKLLTEKIYSQSSINRKLSSLRKYVAWLVKNKYILEYNNTSEYSQIPLPKSLILDDILSNNQSSVIPEIKQNLLRENKYSFFPPIRVLQKLGNLYYFLSDLLFVIPAAKIVNLLADFIWKIGGKKIFTNKKTVFNDFSNSKYHKSFYALRETIYSPKKNILLILKKILKRINDAQPKWLKSYQKSSISTYFNFVILFILSTIIGVGIYNSFFQRTSHLLAANPTAPPRILSFQGRLTDSSDNPITAVTDLRFAVYNDPTATGSALLWQEADTQINPDSNGVFSVIMGKGTSIPQSIFAQNATLYLGITVGKTNELTPRQQLATVPYATNAEVLQGLPPTTDNSVSNNQNVVLALNSSGVLNIQGNANTTFQSSSGQFTLTGKTLTLNTASGTGTNIQLVPDGQGLIDLQKPLVNTTLNNNIRSAGGASTAAGAVEVDSLFAVLATSSGQSAVTIDQEGAGPIFSASHSGTSVFTVGNAGDITDSNYVTGGGIFYGSNKGLLQQTTSGSNGQCLQSTGGNTPTWVTCAFGVNAWQLNSNVIAPYNATLDVAVGGTSTSSALFQVFGATGNATTSGTLTFNTSGNIQTTNNQNITIGGNSTGNILLQPLNGNGNVGLGTTTPGKTLAIQTQTGGTQNAIVNVYGTHTSSNLDYGVLEVTSAGGTIPAGQERPLQLQPNAGTGGTVSIGVGGLNNPLATFDVRANSYTTPVASFSGATGKATLIVDQSGNGDLISASQSGGLRFTVGQDGTITSSKYITNGGLIYANGSGIFSQTTSGTSSQCLIGGSTPTWSTCASGANGTNLWQLNSNVIAPYNATLDLAVGGTSTSSALFQIFGATGNATTSGTLTFTSTGSVIQQIKNQTLTIGGNTTGDIQFKPLNSSSSLYLSGTGNVGIGTTTPSKLLEVNGNAKVDGGLLLAQICNSYACGLSSFNTAGTSRVDIFEDSSNVANINSGANGAENNIALNGTGTGRVGIGTTSMGNGELAVNQPSSSGDILSASQSGNTKFVISNGGNVGIGTTNPSSFILQTTGNVGPNATDTYNLGSASLEWNNIYAKNIITSSSSGSNGFWQLNSKVLSPSNATYDLSIGNTGSSSATPFQVFALAGTQAAGTASQSGAQTFFGSGNAHVVNILDNGTLNFQTSVGGDTTVNSALYIGAGSNTSAGNVGIGTTSPGFALVTAGSGGNIALDTNSGFGAPLLRLERNGNNYIAADQSGGNLMFSTGGTTKTWMSIDNSGNIGIGGGSNYWNVNQGNELASLDLRANQYTSPVASISGATGIASLSLYQSGVGDIFTASSSAGYAGTKFAITNTGNVGVGPTTSLSSEVVDIANSSSANLLLEGTGNSSSSEIDFIGKTAGGVQKKAAIVVTQNGLMNFNQQAFGSGTAMTIATSGNVGIGSNFTNNAAQAALDVRANLYTSPVASISGATGKATLLLDQSGGINGGDIFTASTSGQTKFVITQNGNVGIGTAIPGDKLEIDNGGIKLGTSGQTVDWASGADRVITWKIGNNSTGTCVSGSNGNGVVIQDSGGTQRGHFCITGAGLLKYWADSFNATSTDLAENYSDKDNVLEPGDVVSLDATVRKGVQKTTSVYESNAIGIISTEPGVLLSDISENGGKTDLVNPKPVALSGRIPTKVSTINGPIAVGDMLTSSSIPGVAMKATKPGWTIGKALENDTDTDPQTVGKILAFVNISWADPNILYSINPGDLIISYVDPYKNLNINSDVASETGDLEKKYLVKNIHGNIVNKIDAFASAVIGTLRSGAISSEQIITNNITIAGLSLKDYILSVVNKSNFAVNNNHIISPLAEINELHTNIISPLGNKSNIAVKLEDNNISVSKDASSSAVVTIDNNGNASFSGALNSNQLTVTNDATISGTLHAGKIEAGDIIGLNEKVSTLAAQNITNITNVFVASPSPTPFDLSLNNGQLNSSSSQSGMLKNGENYENIASYSAYLAYVPHLQATAAQFDQGFISFGPASLSDTSITGQLSIGSQLILADNSINVLGADLQLQPLKQGGISIADGQIRIDSSGNLMVNGKSIFNNTLAAKIISPISNNDLLIKLGDNSYNTATGTAQPNLSIQNASGSGVFAINQLGDIIASGSATINKLNIKIAAPAEAVSENEVVATSSAGTISINPFQQEVTIDSNLVTDKSLIYITPVGTPSGQTPYLLRQVPNHSFTVGIPQISNLPTQFNWLVIN